MIQIVRSEIIFGLPEKYKPFMLPEQMSAAIYGITTPPKTRLRFRCKDWATAFVKFPSGIRAFYILDKGDRFTVSEEFEIGRNERL